MDLYIPENKQGDQVYCYDVNSLYPAEMANRKYPTTILGHFIGDILSVASYKLKKKLFKEYVDSLYEIKLNSSKDDPMYMISKLLLNGLFGRYGLDPWLGECEFITKEQFNNAIELGNLKMFELEEKEFSNHILIKK